MGARAMAEVRRMQTCPAQSPACHQLTLQEALLPHLPAGCLVLAQGWTLQLPLSEKSPVCQSPTKEVEQSDHMTRDFMHL